MKKPRYDLREKAFRRYEGDIGKACLAERTVVTPSMRQGPDTYCMRFKDAILGYIRYGYKSDVIPRGINLKEIVALPLQDGNVLLENRNFTNAKLFKQNSDVLPANDLPGLKVFMKRYQMMQVPPGMYIVSYQNAHEQKGAMDLIKSMCSQETMTHFIKDDLTGFIVIEQT